MLASIPASTLNQNRTDLGIPNRFRPKRSCSSVVARQTCHDEVPHQMRHDVVLRQMRHDDRHC
jgi:hypothetical protein